MIHYLFNLTLFFKNKLKQILITFILLLNLFKFKLSFLISVSSQLFISLFLTNLKDL